MATKLNPGDLYEGPKAIATVDGVTAHWAIDEEGELLARLVQIDLSPGDPNDGAEEYRIASDADPAQTTVDALVELEVEPVKGKTTSGV